MSGGHYDYKQEVIQDIIESLELDIFRIKKGRFTDYDDGTFNAELKILLPTINNAMLNLKIAYICVQRLDWLFSGDDGVEEFKERFLEELDDVVGEYNRSKK